MSSLFLDYRSVSSEIIQQLSYFVIIIHPANKVMAGI